ncbi:molybdopterin-dependent oxidoreductase [Nocardioides sp. LHD-245]|uniref:molybdopterin cofactor-binding domain-containing protein n=1 Tax=Nocardioides sp. LHD-245 TaxID=3051387 RepID=UPI0027DF7C14|nr:molybdopterin-dependent oxidoreductase [Nocardioides sp. LHD-245]
MSYVGTSQRPHDWAARTDGSTLFAADLRLPALHAAVLRSPHPYADIVALDTSRAERMPGVVAVITAADFAPDAVYIHRGAPLSDRPPLARGTVRHVGQEVAAVAAETYVQAVAALAAIRVGYRPRTAPLTLAEATAPGARRLHERTTAEPNVSVLFQTEWGDVATGRARASAAVEGRFVYPSVSHACMETNTTLARWNQADSTVELWTSTQAPWFIGKEVSQLLGLEHDQVIFREIATGGGFGSKSKASEHEVLAAALSRKANRPVLLSLTREEELGANKPRHRFETWLRTSVDKDGLVRLYESDIRVDNGSYNHMGPSVMRVGAITLGSMYRPDGALVEARLIDTATQPGGQFRGYGTPQVSLAAESQLDELADRLGLDPLEMRLRNVNREYATTLCGYDVTTARLADCLDAVRTELDWDRRRADPRPDRGVGVAAGSHGSGAYAYDLANRSDAAIDVFDDGRVRVRYGGSDAGTGQSTILAQIAADELGVDLADVEVLSMDSERTPFELGAWSSRGTHMTGSSVGKAASEVAERLRDLARAKLGTQDVVLRDGQAVGADDAVALGDLVRLSDDAVDGMLSHETIYLLEGTEPLAPGKSTANLSPTYAYAAHGAYVEVDRRTGAVELLDYVAAHDVGRAINPTAVEGQIAGGAVMGIGAALGEELVREGGRIVNTSYLHYAMPRSADVPSVRPVIVNAHDPAGPYGAKSVGEMSIIPPGAALANAVHDAVGVRIRELPLTPDKVITALAEKEGRRRRHRIWRRPDRWWIALLRWLYPLGLHHLLHRWGTKLGHGVGSGVGDPESVTSISAPDDLPVILKAAAEGAQVIGGGSDALVERRREASPSTVLISTRSVMTLRGVTWPDDGSLRIGAALTLTELAEATRERIPAIADAVDSIASAQIRNVATVAGNLLQEKRCWFFRSGFPCYKRNGVTSPCYAVMGDHRFQHAVIDGHRCQAVTPSDLATVFTALDARVELSTSNGHRTVPIGEFFTGPGETALRPDEVVVEIVIPAAACKRRSAFRKLNLYTGDFATASAVISAEIDASGTWRDARIALGAIAPVPWRAVEAEEWLRGRTAPTAAQLRKVLDRELDREAHPLPGNGWKLDAVAGLAEHVLESVTS